MMTERRNAYAAEAILRRLRAGIPFGRLARYIRVLSPSERDVLLEVPVEARMELLHGG